MQELSCAREMEPRLQTKRCVLHGASSVPESALFCTRCGNKLATKWTLAYFIFAVVYFFIEVGRVLDAVFAGLLKLAGLLLLIAVGLFIAAGIIGLLWFGVRQLLR